MSRKLVCSTADIPANGMKECVAEGGLRLLVANSGDEFFAYQAICPHQEVPLCEGLYDGNVLTCHQHLWQWDIRSGAPLGLAEAPLEFFPVKVDDGKLYVETPNALQLAELFAGLPDATLERIAGIAKREEHPAGSTLYRLGDSADYICVLESGRVNFEIGRGERTAPAGFALRKGEVFGWNALLEHYPQRIATATCLDNAAILKINGKEMLQILNSEPAAGFLVMRRLASLINRYLAEPGAK
jgi:toluene monooxygenase system ferredoxin subunit